MGCEILIKAKSSLKGIKSLYANNEAHRAKAVDPKESEEEPED